MTLTIRESARYLKDHGIQPSAQRAAIAGYVLNTREHPTAERTFAEVQKSFPLVSKATVYNTLRLLVEHGLLREVRVEAGAAVYDANTDAHHHFIEEKTGEIHDIPWDAVDVCRIESLPGFEVSEYQLVMRGKLTDTQR